MNPQLDPNMYTLVYNNLGVPMLCPKNYYPGTDTTGVDNVYSPNGQTNASTLNDAANALQELAALHNTLLTGNQLIATGAAGEPQSIPVSTIRKPWLDAPDNAVPFDPAGVGVVNGAVTIGTTISLVSFVVPQGLDGVINAYSWNFIGGGFVQGSGDLVAQVLRDGSPVRNYENIVVEKGSVAIPRPIAPLRIFSGQTINLVVNHVSNILLNGNMVGSFVGYFYPSQG